MFKSILSFSELSTDDDQDTMKNRFTRALLHLLKKLPFSPLAAVLSLVFQIVQRGRLGLI